MGAVAATGIVGFNVPIGTTSPIGYYVTTNISQVVVVKVSE